MSFAAALALHYPTAVTLDAFAEATRSALAPHGFEPGNCLPLIGVCRDELMFAVEQRVHEEWGPAFDLSSLAAMVLLGRSGMAAAAHHAPDDAGRRRFVIIVLPHIGIAADGTVGQVQRDGQHEPSIACGALAKIHTELATGQLDLALDRHDLELSLVRMELLRRITYGSVPGLPELTDVARQAASAEAARLASELVHDPDCDVALISGTVVHGPDGDFVAPAECFVSLEGADPVPLSVS